jgi:hypothetical protein
MTKNKRVISLLNKHDFPQLMKVVAKINTVNKIKFIYLNTTTINTYNIVYQYGQLWQKGGCTIYYFFLKYD